MVNGCNNQPIAGALVRVTGTSFTASTAATGDWSLDLPQGVYTFVTSAPNGFTDNQRTVSVVSGPNDAFNIMMDGGTGTLPGRIVNGAGQGIASATVRIDGTALTTTTDANGNFQFTGVPRGQRTVRASATGFAENTLSTNVCAGANSAVQMTLAGPFGSVGGRVTDICGVGVNFALVSVSTGQSARSVSDGTFGIGQVPSGSRNIAASELTYGQSQTSTINVPVGGTVTTPNLVLPGGTHSITGTVLDNANNSPLFGVLVSIPNSNVAPVRSQSDGTFRIDGVPATTNPAGWGVRFSTQNYADASVNSGPFSSHPQDFSCPNSVVSVANVRMTPAVGALTGSVLDICNTGVANVTVQLVTGQGVVWRSTTTNATGAFSFGSVHVGTYTLRTSGVGSNMADTQTTVTIVQDTTISRNLTVTGGTGVVTGTVLIGGSPVAGATVNRTGGIAGQAAVQTDGNGNFTIPNFPAGDQQVNVSHPTFLPNGRDYPVRVCPRHGANQPTATMTIRLPSGQVRGSVREFSSSGNGPVIIGARVSIDGFPNLVTTTDGGGAYTLNDVPVGPQTVTASASGYSNGSQGVSVAENVSHLVHLTLDKAVGTITGRVINARTNQPEPNATVRVQNVQQSTFSDGNGNFTLNGVPAGQQTVEVLKNGFNSNAKAVTLPAGGTVSAGDIPIIPLATCNNTTQSGGEGVSDQFVYMGRTSGTFTFTYQAYTIPDRFILYHYPNGTATVFRDTGVVSNGATLTLTFGPSSSEYILVRVIGDPNNQGNTAWDYTVNCPTAAPETWPTAAEQPAPPEPPERPDHGEQIVVPARRDDQPSD